MKPIMHFMGRAALAAAMACFAIAALPGGGSAAQKDPDSFAGQLLVAAPGIGDPRFDGSVVYLVHHDKNGAFGIVINRPVGDHPIADLLEAMGEKPPLGAAGKITLFAGGPVQTELGFVLHTSDYHDDMTMPVDGRFSLTSDAKILRAIATGHGPKKSLVALGYAGWGPGQLEEELSRNAWYLAPADIELLFDQDRDTVWQRAFDKKTLRL